MLLRRIHSLQIIFLPRRVHLHHFVLRVVLNFDGFVLGPRTRWKWWYDVIHSLHLVNRLATRCIWLNHGGLPHPPSWHPDRNVPLSVLRNDHLLRDVHEEVFLFFLDLRRFLGGSLG